MFYYKNDLIIFPIAVFRNSLRRRVQLKCNACVCLRQKEVAKRKHCFSWHKPFFFIFFKDLACFNILYTNPVLAGEPFSWL